MPDTHPSEITSEQVLALLRIHGRDITHATWRGYVHSGHAPQPIRKVLDRVPVWDADEIRLWQTDRAAWKAKYRAEAQTDPT